MSSSEKKISQKLSIYTSKRERERERERERG